MSISRATLTRLACQIAEDMYAHDRDELGLATRAFAIVG